MSKNTIMWREPSWKIMGARGSRKEHVSGYDISTFIITETIQSAKEKCN